MPTAAVRIPQLGEGLQEALIVEYLKQPGDTIARDEPLYAMETDKGTIEVESPYDGKLVEWLVEEGTVAAIGAAIANMEVAEGVEEMAAGHGPEATAAPVAAAATLEPAKPADSPAPGRKRAIPPRTRRYLREKGVQDESDLIPCQGKKMTPDDVDAYIAAKESGSGAAATTSAPAETEPHNDAPMPKAQQRLNFRLVRGVNLCVPVVETVDADWTKIEAARAMLKERDGDKAPTGFVMMLWCVAQTMARHPKFRSTLVDEGRTLRTYDRVNLGVAVALPDDLLVIAQVSAADTLSFTEFVEAMRERITLARAGTDQATASMSMSVSNLGSVGIRSSIAALVPPAVATLTLGKAFDQAVPDGDSFRFVRRATVTLTFDHRIVNGVGAAEFLTDLEREIEGFSAA